MKHAEGGPIGGPQGGSPAPHPGGNTRGTPTHKTTMTQIDTDDLTDEQIERIINSRGFQKMLAYSRLAEGIEVLADEDEIYDSLVNTITKQHSNVSTEGSVREVLSLFRSEVKTFTEPLVDAEDGEELESETLEEVYVEGDDGE